MAGAANAGASFARCLALSLRRATGLVPPFEVLTRLLVMARNGVGATPHNVGGVPVARCKQSAPAKHPVRGAGEASEVCSITVA